MVDVLHNLGSGRQVMTLFSPEGRVTLLAYPDGSWGILRNGSPLGVWQSDQLEVCLLKFLAAGPKLEDTLEVVLVTRRQTGAAVGLLN